jgi:deoxyribodipyrimidine photo-lyase
VKLHAPLWTVDADAVVPTKFFPKEEFAAGALRPKLHRVLPSFLLPPKNTREKFKWNKNDLPARQPLDENRVPAELPFGRGVQPVGAYQGGTAAGLNLLIWTRPSEALVQWRILRTLKRF